MDELVADELTVLPGVEDLLALAEVHRLATSGMWDVVVVDCGPTAETLRLLGLPEALSGYLERLFPRHRRVLAGIAGGDREGWERTVDALDGLATQLGGLRGMLGDRAATSIRLVLTPERVVAAETRRTVTALALHDLRIDGLVVNRLVPAPPPSLRGPTARWLRERYVEQQAVLAELRGEAGVPLVTVPYAATEPVGAEHLLALATALYGDADPVWVGPDTAPGLRVERTAGTGTSKDSEFELALRLPGAAEGPLDLTRVGDELVVTVGVTRRRVSLPAALRRCEVTAARLQGEGHETDLVVTFAPDPAVWMQR
jgi:arsenite-transporting ATPase